MTNFETKDSGARQQFDSGMQRDTEAGKPRFDLLIPEGVPYEEQLLTRFAALLARGAEKYTERNWEQADSMAEVKRAKSSAFRHFMQWLTGERDEDHAAATLFNIMVVETITRKLEKQAELSVSWTDATTRTIEATQVSLEAIALATGFPVEELNDFASNTLEDDEYPRAITFLGRPVLEHEDGSMTINHAVQESMDRRDSGEIPVEDLRM